MLGLVLFLSLVCLLLLLVRYLQLLAQIKSVTRVTEEIRAGNLNQRYRVRTTQKDLEGLGGSLNRLVDHFQTEFERTRFLEEERKRMVANISHDLRTPLTSLLGYLEALHHDETLTPEERETFLDIAAQKGNALLVVLRDFFELAKLEANDAIIEIQRTNLAGIVPEVLVGFYPDFVEAGITPAVQIPHDPLYVRGDPDHLRRILNNLLANALRYGKDGQAIGVTLREEPDLVWVDVWDRGKGIPAPDLPHVFERLYTGETSRNTALQGSGLGLTITKSLIEKQGGRITVSSTPNEITVFSFCLPKG